MITITNKKIDYCVDKTISIYVVNRCNCARKAIQKYVAVCEFSLGFTPDVKINIHDSIASTVSIEFGNDEPIFMSRLTMCEQLLDRLVNTIEHSCTITAYRVVNDL